MEQVNTIKQLKEFLAENPACMVYFYNDHCAPCIQLRPRIEKLVTNTFPRMKMCFVNGPEHPEMTAEMGVFSFPLILIFLDGKEYLRFNQYVSLAEMEQKIMRYYRLFFDTNG